MSAFERPDVVHLTSSIDGAFTQANPWLHLAMMGDGHVHGWRKSCDRLNHAHGFKKSIMGGRSDGASLKEIRTWYFLVGHEYWTMTSTESRTRVRSKATDCVDDEYRMKADPQSPLPCVKIARSTRHTPHNSVRKPSGGTQTLDPSNSQNPQQTEMSSSSCGDHLAVVCTRCEGRDWCDRPGSASNRSHDPALMSTNEFFQSSIR
jgi:hypothetical protein